ncbi:MAG: LytR C-terminal domain-containing protein, partial [Actinomycetota bacterium]|nr:LytR C-terminal domain-containing protein [Actinomycetota bacterium]
IPGTPEPVGAPSTPVRAPAATRQGNGSAAAPPIPAQRQAPPPPARIRLGTDAGARRPALAASSVPPSPRSSRLRMLLAILVGGLAIAAVVVILIALTSSGSGNSGSSTQAQTSNAPTAQRHRGTSGRTAFNPAGVTVAVLNGTATAGRAHRVALKLAADGLQLGKVSTASDQTHTATTVDYLPGHRSDAVHVASLLKLGPASAAPIDPSTQALACPAGALCSVVVTVGSDLTTIP